MPKRVDHSEVIRFVLNRAYWFGSVKRQDVTRKFDISDDLASRIIGKLRSDNVLQASGHQLSLLPAAIKSELVRENVCSERFLAELTLLQRSDQDITLSCGGRAPSWSTSSLMRTARPEVLREILAAIREVQSVEILYVEKGKLTDPVRRTIEPVELFESVGQWSVDAHCYVEDRRLDFDLLYVVEAKNRSAARYRMAAQSRAQNHLTMMDVRFVPHPALGDAQRKVVEFQFQMRNGLLELKAPLSHVDHLRDRFVAPTPFKVEGDQVLFEQSVQQTCAAEFGLYCCGGGFRGEATIWKEHAYILLQALQSFIDAKFESADRMAIRAWLTRLMDAREMVPFVYAEHPTATAAMRDDIDTLKTMISRLPGASEGVSALLKGDVKKSQALISSYGHLALEITAWLRHTAP